MKKDTPQQKAEKRRNLAEAQADRDELLAYGYQIHEFTPWHWRISRYPDWKLEIDLWPTSKKLMDREEWIVHQYRGSTFQAVHDLFTSDKYAA